MINPLRLYDVPPGNQGPFLDRFRDHAARLMRAQGFAILGNEDIVLRPAGFSAGLGATQ